MKDSLLDAEDELKRAEHLLFVSMKYTRTADVIKAIIERLVSAYTFMFDGLLKYSLGNGKKFDYPNTPGLKINKLRELFPNETRLLDEIDFYVLLKKILRSDFRRENEYRRHVAMIIKVEDKELSVDYDTVMEYYRRAINFLDYLKVKYLGEEEPI